MWARMVKVVNGFAPICLNVGITVQCFLLEAMVCYRNRLSPQDCHLFLLQSWIISCRSSSSSSSSMWYMWSAGQYEFEESIIGETGCHVYTFDWYETHIFG